MVIEERCAGSEVGPGVIEGNPWASAADGS